MKRIYITLFLCFVCSISYTQIRFAAEKPDKKPTSVIYDSLQNFIGKNAEEYIGQILTVIKSTGKYKKTYYEGFLKSYSKSRYAKNNIYSPSRRVRNINDGTPYEDVFGKYYLVKDVLRYDSEVFLMIEDKKTGEELYYHYRPEFRHTFPFIVVGYFEKMKNLYMGREYYARNKKLNHYAQYKNISTDTDGNEFYAEIGSIWRIVDILVKEDGNSNLQFTMECDNTQISVLLDLFREYDFVPVELYSDIAKKYSPDILHKVLSHNYYLGWDQNLVLKAIGHPLHINKSESTNGYDEQWVYGDGEYLYFTNGILTTIQN